MSRGGAINVLHILVVFICNGLLQCCAQATKSECRTQCKELKSHGTKKVVARRKNLGDLVTNCPRSQKSFWQCLPTTKVWKDYVRRQQSKRRQVCCKEAVHKSCQLHCYTTKDVTTVLRTENCNRIREPKLWECVQRIHASKKCCKGSQGGCKDACKRYFDQAYNSVLDGKSHLERSCGKHSPQYKCVMKQSDFKNGIKDFTMCCSKGTTKECERACQQEHQQLHNYSVLLERLPKHCGKVDWQVPMWKCFLDKSMENGKEQQPEPVIPGVAFTQGIRPTINRGPGKIKDQCCYRAKSEQCRYWCTSLTSSPSLMGTWETMYLSCIQDPKESELSNCMSDILEPCQIGAKAEMRFCSNFNNRPLELFRRCDEHGDNEALTLYQFWSEGYVHVLNYNLKFKDISKCQPEKFKAMACLISIKPCDHFSARRQVCRRDCEELLHTCLDHEELTEPVKVEDVCAAMLPKDNQTGCISVSDYLSDTPVDNTLVKKDEVTQPCDDNPCGKGEVCVINRECVTRKRRGATIDPMGSPILSKTCKKYTCLKGCRVSGQSNVLVPVGQRAKLPKANRRSECYQVCVCKIRETGGLNVTYFHECHSVGCKKGRRCTLKKKKLILEDGEEFTDGCNTCACDDGELLCTRIPCGGEQDSGERNLLSGRPRRHHTPHSLSTVSACNCGGDYTPVCGSNGMTYPNDCVARCFQLEGRRSVLSCNRDHCFPNPCNYDEKCIPLKAVCLSTNPNNFCPQYVCANNRHHNPTGCPPALTDLWNEVSDKVCGYDGVEYPSACFALASGTGVDFQGPCMRGNIRPKENRCSNVICPRVSAEECHLFLPPGACCPVCGSMLRVLYSQRDLSRHRNFVNDQPITVLDVIKQLRHLQKVAECTLYGHRSIEGDIVVLVLVNTGKPTKRQVHACAVEAERINKYINNASPVMTPFYHLSILKVSRLKKARWKDIGSSSQKLFSSSHHVTLTWFLLTTLIAIVLGNTR